MARTLVAAGYDVEIAAVAAPGLPAEEQGEGWTLRRYRRLGPVGADGAIERTRDDGSHRRGRRSGAASWA